MVDLSAVIDHLGTDALKIRLRVLPRSAKSRICGIHGTALKVCLKSPPLAGRANRELIAFLARQLGLKKKDLTLAAGKSCRTKSLIITAPDRPAVVRRLSLLVAEQ